jgi:regulatory protein
MPRVVSILSARQPGFMRVRMAGGRALRVPEEACRALGVEVGEISPETLRRLRDQEDCARLRERAMRLLAARPRSRAELRARLLRLAPADRVARVLVELEEQGLLDDERFARLWAESRRNARGFGALRIRRELREKGVPHDVIERVVKETERDEDAGAETLARLRLRAYAGLDRKAAARRLSAFLARRGFRDRSVIRALRRVGLFADRTERE